MAVFNIIGHGFLDVTDPSGVAFKMDNPFYRFADASLGRSTEFSVPGTDHNRRILQYGDDPAEYGDMLRRVFAAQLVYDGGAVNGTISVTAFDADTFKCVFHIGGTEWISFFQKKKMKDLPLLNPITATWYQTEPADTDRAAMCIAYDRTGGFSGAPCNPCVNIKKLIGAILAPMGIGAGYAPGLQNYWLVTPSMVGGTSETVQIDTTAADNMTVTGDGAGYLTVEDIDIEWATVRLWSSGLVGGGSFPAKGLKATRAIKMTFPSGVDDIYVVQWSQKLSRYKSLAGPGIGGVTIDIPKDAVIFFAATPVYWTGYRDTYHPLSVSVTIESQEANLQPRETWNLASNMPDMTFFEFLKSVALATGNDLYVTPTDVAITPSEYGERFARNLANVISVDKVTRAVDAWGNGTRTAKVRFDSEDYVAEPLSTEYAIDNDQLEGSKEVKSAFSEGGVGEHGILINDWDMTGNTPKLVAKKWTIAYAEDGDKYLQRVEAPSAVSYDDIAANSTCISVKVAAPLAEFMELSELTGPMRLWLWRGSSYVWTSASWSDGVLTMTLQLVSQPSPSDIPAPPPTSV